ncbi:MAG: hypothetical protein JWN04_967, partial [Myxococcaceae bacterium]|nr:hypothetical protein [Myxococcaceae bacterium]
MTKSSYLVLSTLLAISAGACRKSEPTEQKPTDSEQK